MSINRHIGLNIFVWGVAMRCLVVYWGVPINNQAMRNWHLADEWIVTAAVRRYWRVGCRTRRGSVVPRGPGGNDRDTCALVVPIFLQQNIQHSPVHHLTLSSSVNLKNNCKIRTHWSLVTTETTDKVWTQDEAA